MFPNCRCLVFQFALFLILLGWRKLLIRDRCPNDGSLFYVCRQLLFYFYADSRPGTEKSFIYFMVFLIYLELFLGSSARVDLFGRLVSSVSACLFVSGWTSVRTKVPL